MHEFLIPLRFRAARASGNSELSCLVVYGGILS